MQKLYKHQIDFLYSPNIDKTSLVWSCGTGKSLTALEWSKLGRGQTLIICPKALVANWWREAEKSGVKQDVQVITKETFRKLASKMHKFDNLIVDECHAGFLTPMFKSQMSKALKKYLAKHSVPRVLLLSATVYTSSPWNIYNLAFYTGHIWNYRQFQDDFFTQVKMGARLIPVAKKGIEGKLAEMTRSIASVVDIHDVLDVPLQNHLDPEYFALSKEQQKAIKDNYDPLPIVRYTNQHEIENGFLLSNEFRDYRAYECDKNERIEELIRENKKIAIVCRYNAQIKWFEILCKQMRVKYFVINGEVKDRDKVTLEAEVSEECVIIIQADCCEGYNLPSVPLCIFASMSYSYTKWEQICGRFLRMDKPSRTTFMYLLTEGKSIDQAVYDSVKKKEDFKIQLYEK